jgi:hypothetical protein
MVVYDGWQVGAVGVPVNAIEGAYSVPGMAQIFSPGARLANWALMRQEVLGPTYIRMFAQLAPEGCPQAHGLHA